MPPERHRDEKVAEGDCLAAKLRPGNIHSADGWDEVLLPIIDRYRARGHYRRSHES